MTRKDRPSYRLIFALGCIPPAALAWMCVQTLAQPGDPVELVRRFDSLQAPLTWIVPLVFLALHVSQAAAYRRGEASGWGWFSTWLYFALFTAIDYVWLSDMVFRYTKNTETWQGGFSVAPLIGVALIAAAGVASLVLYFAMRSRRRD